MDHAILSSNLAIALPAFSPPSLFRGPPESQNSHGREYQVYLCVFISEVKAAGDRR